MGQGALSKPPVVVQWWLSLNSSTSESWRHRDAAAVAGLRNPTPPSQTTYIVEGKPIRSFGYSQAGIL